MRMEQAHQLERLDGGMSQPSSVRKSRRTGREKIRHPSLTTALKVRLGGEQGWRCCCCGHPVGLKHHIEESQASANIRLATFEHLRPKELSGDDSIDNLAISCWDCNHDELVWPIWRDLIEDLERERDQFLQAA